MNGISGKHLLSTRQNLSILDIHTDENIKITTIIGADGTHHNSNGDIMIEVHFDIKSGYRFSPDIITNTGTYIWDSLNGVFIGTKPDTKLQISVASIAQKLSKPVISVNNGIITFVPGDDWGDVDKIVLYEGSTIVYSWLKSLLVNNTADLSRISTLNLPVGEHTLSVIYTQLSRDNRKEDSLNSSTFEYTVIGDNDE